MKFKGITIVPRGYFLNNYSVFIFTTYLALRKTSELTWSIPSRYHVSKNCLFYLADN